MSVQTIRSEQHILRSSLGASIHRTPENAFTLMPSNILPNPSLSEIGESGFPLGYDGEWNIPRVAGHHYYLTHGTSDNPPRESRLSRQSTAFLPGYDAFTATAALSFGYRISGNEKYSKPPPPEFQAVGGAKGFEAGQYGYAAGFAQNEKKRTPPGGTRFFPVANGRSISIPVPESFPEGTRFWEIYLTKKNAAPGSELFLQRRIPLSELTVGGTYTLDGPHQNRGKAPTKNTTGYGLPGKPKKGRDYWLRPDSHDLVEGIYRVARQWNGAAGERGKVSQFGAPYVVRSDRVWVLQNEQELRDAGVPIPTRNGVNAREGYSDAEVAREIGEVKFSDLVAVHGYADSEAHTSSTRFSNSRDAEGKRTPAQSPYVAAGGTYAGEEVDFEEARLIGLINDSRREARRGMLIQSRDLCRLAYRAVGGRNRCSESGYEGNVHEEAVITTEDRAEDAFSALSDAIRASKYAMVGVAREREAYGRYRWSVVFGDYAEPLDTDTPATCETVDPDGTTHVHGHDEDGNHTYIESVAPDGTRFADSEHADASMNPPQGWSCVKNFSLNYSYSGSYGTAVSSGAAAWDGKSRVSVKSGGSVVRVSDASFDAYGRCYSDGRIYLNASTFSRAVASANKMCVMHEFGHAFGLPHSTGTSVMQTPINTSGSGNISNPTSQDVNTVVSVWGDAQESPGTGGGTGGETGGGTGGGTTPEPPPEPQWVQKSLGVKRNTCLYVRSPNAVRGNRNPDLRWSPWIMKESLTGGSSDTGTGGMATYRAYLKRSNVGANHVFGGESKGDLRLGVRINGYEPGSEPRGVRIALVQEELPTEDTSQIPSPDPASLPDAPVMGGTERPPAGSYLAAVQQVLETEDGIDLSPLSVPVEGSIASSQLVKLTPQDSVNIVRNATFSRINAEGIPEDWTPVGITNVATNSYSVAEPGVLTLTASANTPTAPRLDNRLTAVSSADTLFVAGIVGYTSITNGTVRLSVRQHREDGSYISDLLIGEVASGETGEKPVSRKLLPTDRHAECAFVSLSPRISGSTVQASGYFKRLRILPFASDVRYVDFPADGELAPASFETEDDAQIAAHSFTASGVPPIPEGTPAPEAEPPIDHISFASGIPAGWTEAGTSAQKGVTTVNPIHGTHSYRVADGSTGAIGTGYIHRTYSSSILEGTEAAFRAVYRFDQLPTASASEVLFHRMAESSGNRIAQLRLHTSGSLYLYDYDTSGRERSTLIGQVYAGRAFDVEIIYRGGANGSVSVGFSTFGSPRRYTTLSRNFGGKKARQMLAGVLNSNKNQTRYEAAFYGVVVTERGDVLMREQPQVPPTYTPEPPDRPKLDANTYRHFTDPSFDPENETVEASDIHQMYFFVKPGDAAEKDMLEDPAGVKSGRSYTLAMFHRHTVFGEVPPEARNGVRVRLEGDGLEDFYPDVEDSGLTGWAGERGWHASGFEDDFLTFTVPDMISGTDDKGRELFYGYTRCQIELEMQPGVYVVQEPLLSEGILSTFAERDAARTLSRATEGEMTFVFDAMPEAWDMGLPAVGTFFADFGIRREALEDLPEGTSVTAYFSVSDDGLSWSPETTDPEEIRIASEFPGSTFAARRFLRIRIVLTGEGVLSPTLPAESIFLGTWTPVGVLLREDGSHFPGCAFVGNLLYESTYPDTNIETVGGHYVRVRESEDIDRITGNLTITTATEEAMREIMYLSATGQFRMEVPTADGTVPGMEYLVEFGEQVIFPPKDIAPRVSSGHRQVYASVEVQSPPEIIESAPLSRPFARHVRFGKAASGAGVLA